MRLMSARVKRPSAHDTQVTISSRSARERAKVLAGASRSGYAERHGDHHALLLRARQQVAQQARIADQRGRLAGAEPLVVGGEAHVLHERRRCRSSRTPGRGSPRSRTRAGRARRSSRPCAPWRRPGPMLRRPLPASPRASSSARPRAPSRPAASRRSAVPARSEASSSSRSSAALNAALKRSSASPVTTQTFHAWVLRDDGAQRASSRISRTSSSGPAATCRRGCSAARG